MGAANPGMESEVLDVEDGASIKPSAQALVKRFPNLNVVLHSAGLMRPENLLSGDDLATAEATISTNLLGTIDSLPPSFLKSSSSQTGRCLRFPRALGLRRFI